MAIKSSWTYKNGQRMGRGSKAAKDAVIEFINEVLPYDERVDAEILINEKLLRF